MRCCLDKNKKRYLAEGTEKIEKHLDVVNLIEMRRAFKTFQRILITKSERILIRHQRHERVLNPDVVSSEELIKPSSSSDDAQNNPYYIWRAMQEGQTKGTDAVGSFISRLRKGVLNDRVERGKHAKDGK